MALYARKGSSPLLGWGDSVGPYSSRLPIYDALISI